MLKFIKCRANANDDFIGTFTRTGNAVSTSVRVKTGLFFCFVSMMQFPLLDAVRLDNRGNVFDLFPAFREIR